MRLGDDGTSIISAVEDSLSAKKNKFLTKEPLRFIPNGVERNEEAGSECVNSAEGKSVRRNHRVIELTSHGS